MQFKEGSLSLRRCGPTSHESLCQRWPPYLPATGRLVAGFRRAKCHHLVRCSTLVSSPNVTMEQKLFSFLNPLQWIEGSEVIPKPKRLSSRRSRYFFSGGGAPAIGCRDPLSARNLPGSLAGIHVSWRHHGSPEELPVCRLCR